METKWHFDFGQQIVKKYLSSGRAECVSVKTRMTRILRVENLGDTKEYTENMLRRYPDSDTRKIGWAD